MEWKTHPATPDHLDDFADVVNRSIVCFVVQPGHRRQGVTALLLQGAVGYAASHGPPALEAYPVDPPGRMDLT